MVVSNSRLWLHFDDGDRPARELDLLGRADGLQVGERLVEDLALAREGREEAQDRNSRSGGLTYMDFSDEVRARFTDVAKSLLSMGSRGATRAGGL